MSYNKREPTPLECMRNNFQAGVTLDGRFETVALLNHGSFGQVFSAKDLTTGELVAIKCLTKPSAGSICPSGISIDDRSEELACHARLGLHPSIVNLLHHFETDAHIYLVLEYCANGDLYEAIRSGKGPLVTDNVRDSMLQLIDAVEHMHSEGLYHRDIKPENIFLSHAGDLKLGDFGLATDQAWTHESNVGSDRYMSPEQYDSAGAGYSPAHADIWALGICLINMIYSRNPFVTPTASDVLFADFLRDKQNLFDVFPTMSQDMFEVLRHSLSIDPEKRSLTGMREALHRVISFTTDDESLDEFCTEESEPVLATANRQPLRTPSIQSPQVEAGGSFPWARALRFSPRQPVRQLSIVREPGHLEENVLPSANLSKESWFAINPDTPSIASIVDSGLGASLKSLVIRQANGRETAPDGDDVRLSGSMPIPTKAKSGMASVFGKKDEVVSKSWSDLWDEEEEQTEVERQQVFEDQDAEKTVTMPHFPDVSNGLAERDSNSAIRRANLINTDETLCGPGLDGANENNYGKVERQRSSQNSSPTKAGRGRGAKVDKWEALGEWRRAATTTAKKTEPTTPPLTTKHGNWRHEFGLGVIGHDVGVLNGKEAEFGHQDDIGDLEWVGGWHDLHL